MQCSNGRVRLDPSDERLLFAESGGYCARAGEWLFEDLGTRRVALAELAHIVAASRGGPRGESNLDDQQRADPSNIVLLCPTCHTLVDKAPEEFPVAMLRQWKEDRRRAQALIAGVPHFTDRAAAAGFLRRLLDENRAAHRMYGPDSLGADDPIGEKASQWQRKMLNTILPNSRRGLAMLDINRDLLTDDERDIVEEWRQHVDDLAARHVLGVAEPHAARFPARVDALLDDHND